jgi:TatA/E family protein of Tat protein translocase
LGFDDPVVIILIVAIAIFLFGSAKIPEFAKNLGKAKRAFQEGFTQALTKPEDEKKTTTT